MTAIAVSATLISIKVCEAGKPAATEAIPIFSFKYFLTTGTIDGYTQMAATLSKCGKAALNPFTFSTIEIISASVSVPFSEVKSIRFRHFL